MMDAARKRAQRRAVYLAKRRGDPQQSIQVVGSRCRTYRDDGLYQATQDQQGLLSKWKNSSWPEQYSSNLGKVLKSYGSLRMSLGSVGDEEGLQHVNQEMEAKAAALFGSDRSHPAQAPASKGSYSQVAFSYDGDGKEETNYSDGDEDDDDDEDEDDEDFNSDDSNDEEMEKIAKEFGVKRYGWLVYMDKKAKEEEKRQKEVVKGDPSIRKLTRKERRKVSQIEREREREAAQVTGTRLLHRDPYREPRRSPTYEAYSRSRRSRSRSRSHSPSHSRRNARGVHSNDGHRSKSKPSKIEYITEFAGSADGDEPKLEGFSPPPSPSKADVLNRLSSIMLPEAIICGLEYMKPRPVTGQILEALHTDPASSVSLDKEKNTKVLPQMSTSSALARLSKSTTSGGVSKQEEKKETPQERLKRIMSRQLNKQIKKDTAVEMAKKKEQERQRNEKLAETSRLSRHRRRSHSRSYSRSPPRPHRDRVLLHNLRRVAQASIMASCRHEMMPFLLLDVNVVDALAMMRWLMLQGKKPFKNKEKQQQLQPAVSSHVLVCGIVMVIL
ncbi:hypothetical protein RHSIM_Rhsim08G0100400 [Rhododendron simsii]|uniref:Suppressor of white apricot N-terminal domain-containing protein n=1 Tax=Rhododendron simsii TaxID=118357 RepID=A0A834LFX7_RHOSS|nr:hypothetical protein RHSIM_Rhsim08G0100400 [Rhododendron simsii]